MRIKARKRLGQHFLEPVWVNKVLAVLAPSPNDLFLEIGPGRGALTHALAASGAHVIAVEVDRRLADQLQRKGLANVVVLTGDFLKVDVAALLTDRSLWKLSESLRIVGNLPYNISSPILAKLIHLYRDGLPVHDATLMLQREVADRLVANAGTSAYGPLAIMVQLYSDAARVLTLPPGAFRPVPKVRSAVVRLTFRRATVPLPDPATFEALVRSLFSQRRKTVLNALKPFASQCGLCASELLSRARLNGGRRPGELDLAELAELAEVLVSARQEAVL